MAYRAATTREPPTVLACDAWAFKALVPCKVIAYYKKTHKAAELAEHNKYHYNARLPLAQTDKIRCSCMRVVNDIIRFHYKKNQKKETALDTASVRCARSRGPFGQNATPAKTVSCHH